MEFKSLREFYRDKHRRDGQCPWYKEYKSPDAVAYRVRRRQRASTIRKLATALGVEPRELMKGEE